MKKLRERGQDVEASNVVEQKMERLPILMILLKPLGIGVALVFVIFLQ